jgi:glycosyltransferase involved in cell wall biosynthesis
MPIRPMRKVRPPEIRIRELKNVPLMGVTLSRANPTVDPRISCLFRVPRENYGVVMEMSQNKDGAIELSIVMPCLNEAETIVTCVGKAQTWLRESGTAGEVLVADNGSTDGSPELATKAGARVITVREKGYGAALIEGISAARGEFVIVGDADDSYDFGKLDAFAAKLREGCDLVMGNRFAGDILPGAMPRLHRYFGTPILTTVSRLFFGSVCRDIHCGLRGFRKSAIQKLRLQTIGMEFASEMVVKATLYGLRITEVPIVLSPAGRSRPPHLRSWRDGWRHLRFYLLYSPRWLFLYPGIILLFGGFAISIWLLRGPIYVESIAFDVHTLLYAAMAMVLGFQAIIFAIFTKTFAINEQLLPEDPRFDRWFNATRLEAGLLLGAALCVFGLAGSIWAVLRWKSHAFGRLDSSEMLRIVIPSVTALTIGSQAILSSFFLSILGLRRRR